MTIPSTLQDYIVPVIEHLSKMYKWHEYKVAIKFGKVPGTNIPSKEVIKLR